MAEIVDAGLDELPGVSSSTTFLPNEDLTPREVGRGGRGGAFAALVVH